MKKIIFVLTMMFWLVGSVFGEELKFNYKSGDYSIEITCDTNDKPESMKDTGMVYYQAGIYAEWFSSTIGVKPNLDDWNLKDRAPFIVPDYMFPTVLAEKYGICYVEVTNVYNDYYYVFITDGTTKLVVWAMDKNK